ncbi:hypothetical protein BDZ97DRAFT_1754067 [Flammula alnicola]|nr:hypothetical protein BDZ97DRAFT_1754067 [Flammula alnicola]
MSFSPIHRIRGASPSWLTTGVGGSGSGSGSGIDGGPGSGGLGSGGLGSGSASVGSVESRRHEQELINAYEAEEERIINVLSRKLEQLREDKIDLENALEAESENHVNKLSRELGALRQANRELEAQLAQLQAKPSGASGGTSSAAVLASSSRAEVTDGSRQDQEPEEDAKSASVARNLSNLTLNSSNLREPSTALMLQAMQRENETLRNRLVDTERDYVRVSRLNEVYREELIEHRSRLGLPVDNLIGLTQSDRDPFAHPTHHRRSRSSSASSSPSASLGGGYYPPFYGFVGGAYANPPVTSNSHITNGHGHAGYQHQYQYQHTYSNSNSNANSNTSSPSTSAFHVPSSSYVPRGLSLGGNGTSSIATASTSTQAPPSQAHGVPIPRPPSQIQPLVHAHTTVVASSTSGSPYPLSPYSASGASSSSDSYANEGRYSGSGASVANPASFVSVSTNLTSPPSSLSFGGVGGINGMGMGGMLGGTGTAAYGVPQRGLSYPSVPPPSLSSSFGSPTVPFHIPHRGERDASLSPVEPLSRRESNAGMGGGGGGAGSSQGSISRRGSHGGGGGERRVVETGSLRRASFDRGAGIPIGGRVAETGSLVGRSRAGSVNLGLGHGALPETVDEDEVDDTEGMELEVDGGQGESEEGPEMLDAAGYSRPTATASTVSGNGADSEGVPPAKSR